jgi:hypothetical protein
MLRWLTLIFFCVSSLNVLGQSFIVQVNKDTIYSENFYITDEFLKYSLPNDETEYKIPIERVKGYYSEPANTFYEKKLFSAKTRGGFLNLSYKKRDYFNFVELVFDGKIKTYRGKDFYIETVKKNYWFIEKEDSLQVAFIADYDEGGLKLKNARYGNLNKDFFNTIFSDEEKALEAINDLKKTGKLHKIRTLVNDYNNRNYDEFANNNANINSSMASVTFLRDSRKELKDDLKLLVNNKPYYLPKNSKLKLQIPTNRLTKVCIENSQNAYCRLVSSSKSFPTFYKLILDKDDLGDLFRVNGLSNYYKVRLENYKSVE